jgi:phosphoglycolate phosphatase
MHPNLIAFDLDGTLIDSAGDLHTAVNHMLAEFGATPLSLAEVRSMVGDGASLLVSRALAARQCIVPDQEGALRIFLGYYEKDPISLTKAYPGVPETLDLLRTRGVPLAVCTNKPAGLASLVLERLGLDHYFGRVIGGDSLPVRKPDPRMLTELLNWIGATPSASLMVGDSEVDAATARAASVPFVLMTYGYRRGAVADISHLAAFNHFRELAGLLDT